MHTTCSCFLSIEDVAVEVAQKCVSRIPFLDVCLNIGSFQPFGSEVSIRYPSYSSSVMQFYVPFIYIYIYTHTHTHTPCMYFSLPCVSI